MYITMHITYFIELINSFLRIPNKQKPYLRRTMRKRSSSGVRKKNLAWCLKGLKIYSKTQFTHLER